MIGQKPRALIVASVPSHINTFHTPYIGALSDLGWDVDVATSGADPVEGVVHRFSVPFARSPFALQNLKAFRDIRSILRKNHYDVVHVHTPTAAAITRIAAIPARRHGTRVIYTAHGFHFHTGASPRTWMAYFPVEKLLARVTDQLVTINSEDYDRAKRLLRTNVRMVNGVGVDPARFQHQDQSSVRAEKRAELGIGSDDFVALCVGELNTNKNREVLVQAWSRIVAAHPDHRLLIAGKGPLADELASLIDELDLKDNVFLLGPRADVPELLAASDTLLAPSLREGLPVNVIEAMMAGCAVIASDNRGHRELIESGVNGLILADNSPEEWENNVELLAADPHLKDRLSTAAKAESGKYSVQNVLPRVLDLYRERQGPASEPTTRPRRYDNPSVSVIVPAFNVEGFIEQCLASLAAQTYRNLEVVVIDDGSTDATAECAENALRAGGVRGAVISQPNGGLPAARNAGMGASSGELVCFVDGDDTVAPDYVETLVRAIQGTGAQVAECRLVAYPPTDSPDWSGSRTRVRVLKQPKALVETLYGRALGTSACGKLASRELWQQHPFQEDLALGEDLAVVPGLIADASSVALVDAGLYGMVTRPGSITRNRQDYVQSCFDLARAVEACSEAVPADGAPELQSALRARRSQEYCRLVNLADTSDSDSEHLAEMRTEAMRFVRANALTILADSSAPVRLRLRVALTALSPKAYSALWARQKRREGWLDKEDS